MKNDYIEKLSLSIVREYLVRRGFSETLKTLDNESSSLLRTIGCYHSRLSLGKDLFLGSYIKINKEAQFPLVSMLEILIKVFLEERIYLDDGEEGVQIKSKKSILKKLNHITHHHEIKNCMKPELMEENDALKFYLSAEIKESKNRASIDQIDETLEADLATKTRELEECYIETATGASASSCVDSGHHASNNVESRGAGDFKILKSQTTIPPPRPKVLFNRFVEHQSSSNQLAVGQNLLETKQNILAQTSLSVKENEIRSEAQEKAKVTEFELKMVDLSPEEVAAIAPKSSSPFVTRKIGAGKQETGSRLPKPIIKCLDMNTWKALRTVVFGQRGCLHEGWVGQGFPFNHKVPFGLIQKKGGPCGVLAVVQALILRNLMFGSPYTDHEDKLPVEEPILNYDASSSIVSKIASKRIPALIAALAEILWKCGTMKENSILIPTNKEDGKSVANVKKAVAVCFNGLGNMPIGTGSELRVFYDLDELKVFIRANLYRFDCIGLVYSAVLSRGIQNIQDDMDFPNSPLLGQHGYCTVELINLLTMGQGISNAFDNEFVLGDKILKGLKEQADIGFLSLFEHYDSCRVGTFLKDPKFPLWIICSESHFSLLFSNDMDLTGKNRKEEMKSFDLYYYDGLASQDKLIRLTIDIIDEPINGNNNANNGNDDDGKASSIKLELSQDEELIPPLEKCIRTKWKGAKVDWNETEPIL